MGFRREAAIRAMLGSSSANDLMTKYGLPLYAPPPGTALVQGALPAMTRELIPWSKSLIPVDLVILSGIGDFPPDRECSSYYDPSSPWYHVFFGAYAMLSHKPDGTPWGYTAAGRPDFDEFLRIPALDYNYSTAGQFRLSAGTDALRGHGRQPAAAVRQRLGCGRRDGAGSLRLVRSDAALRRPREAFGMPDPSLLNGRSSDELVPMRGQYDMRRLSLPAGKPPITVVWGAVRPDTDAGLLGTIMQALRPHYPNAYP